MPRLAVLAAAAQVGDDEDYAAIEIWPHVRGVHRAQIDAVAAVSVEQDRIVPVKFCALTPDDVEGHLSAVLGSREFANHLGIAEIGRARFAQRCGREFFRRRIVALPGGWRQESLDAQ